MLKTMTLAMLAMTAASAHAADREDAAINAVYDSLASAKAENSPDAMARAFAADATLISPMPTPAGTGAGLKAALAPMAARLRDEGVQVATAYRIERRTRFGDVAIDAGYMRTHFSAPAGKPKPNDMLSRFLVTLRRQPDGKWLIVADASLPAAADAWEKVERKDGLKFDD